ncbi:MAG TPA: polymer-forming cytoskeletal protein [Thermodesulfovibrionales bacterium]|nr:polymer-forming cytoskeletal protein [Thermodesulfovibrionales bacterium]
MFSKNTEKLESFVGTNSNFKGDIRSKGTIRIDGTVEGNIEADWLVLGEKANIKGDVSARGVIVGGRIEGNMNAREILEIRSKGQIIGDICTLKLVVAEGGMLVGRTSMNREGSNVVELPVKEKSG